MKIEEEKKLVAEKLMGWKYKSGLVSATPLRFNEGVTVGPDWDIDTERKGWDEIWENLSYEQEKSYSDNLWLVLGANGMDTLHHNQMLFHTAKPEICWKALIRTLEVKNGN